MHVWGCRLGSHGLVASSMEGHGCQALPYDGEVELGHIGYAQHPWYKTGSPSPQSWMTQKAGLYLWSHDGLQPLASIPCGCCQHRKACEVPLAYPWHEAWPLWEKGPAKLVKVSSQKLQVHKHHQSGIPQVEYDIQKRITRAFEYPCMHACHSKFADAHFTKSIISSSGWWGGLQIHKIHTMARTMRRWKLSSRLSITGLLLAKQGPWAGMHLWCLRAVGSSGLFGVTQYLSIFWRWLI